MQPPLKISNVSVAIVKLGTNIADLHLSLWDRPGGDTRTCRGDIQSNMLIYRNIETLWSSDFARSERRIFEGVLDRISVFFFWSTVRPLRNKSRGVLMAGRSICNVLYTVLLKIYRIGKWMIRSRWRTVRYSYKPSESFLVYRNLEISRCIMTVPQRFYPFVSIQHDLSRISAPLTDCNLRACSSVLF